MHERILDGAATMLRQLPLSKLTMDDIARSAGIARQTIYKHFANKDEIVAGLFVQEIEQHHRPVMYALHAEGCSHDQLTALVLRQIQLADRWVLLSRTFDPSIAPRVAELVLSSDDLAACNAALWLPILADYRAAGLLRGDLDLRQTVRWMTYQAVWLLSHPDALTPDPHERRRYVHTYLTGGLVKR